MTEVDYKNYSLDELLESRESIDRERFPERAALIDNLILEKAIPRLDSAELKELKTRAESEDYQKLPPLIKAISELASAVVFVLVGITFFSESIDFIVTILYGSFVLVSLVSGFYHLKQHFFQRKPEQTLSNKQFSNIESPRATTQAIKVETRSCANCDAEVSMSVTYCMYCGKKA
ncbi:hypothetical protein [Paraferrimonas sp. SM1919]|uniref:hypothetical protein n=1 Tax=Paraferrimonas sp. SM1919 TaxID=2662263 RepID=UPI0013D79237|nr:hypothetical protein [Paraferrimonas sp. SM1919]